MEVIGDRSRRAVVFHLVKDDHGEGHVLASGSQDDTATRGDSGTIVFTKGGPTGGYWKFTKDK